ncbi:MAG: hypothetical protein AB8B50_02165 [Pirellulaceae bacterium]
MNASNAEAAQGGPEVGFSGRKTVLVTVLGLLVVGGGLSYVLWTYNRIDSLRSSTEKAWFGAVDLLAERYRAVEPVVAERVDDEQWDMAKAEQFRLALDRFRNTVQSEVQMVAAREVEESLDGFDFPNPPGSDLIAAAEEFNQRIASQRELLDSPGGVFLEIFLKFPESQPVQLAGSER